MPEVRFDDQIAATYDEDSGERWDPAVLGPTVDLLVDLADGGPVLEFAVGTGRVALPLAGRGLPVSGLDISEPMLARLRAKPGAAAVSLTTGDFTCTRVGGDFSIVYLVFNTIMNVASQDAQVATFRNAAAHLVPGGCFVVEVGVPALQRLPPGETVRAFALTPGYVGFDEYDVVSQTLWSHHYRVGDGRARVSSAPYRYVWPAELDLMAQLAGLQLQHRWADWTRSPFTSESTEHVSVWRKPLGAGGPA